MNAAEIAAALKGKRAGSGGWTALCPAHDDHTPSLSIRDADDGKVLVRCRAGCGQQDVIKALRQRGLWPSREPQQKKRTNGPAASRGSKSPIVATYVYKQADGTPYLRVEQTADKQFPQAHWTGKAWAYGKPPGPKIPYRLPDIIDSSTVFICEGEKDADNVAKLGFGFATTTNSEGADDGKGGKWTADLNPYFKGKTVYILADNDDVGAKHAQFVASNLHGIADSVRVVHLPGLQDKGDVTDWLKAGGTAQQLLDICRDTPLWTLRAEDTTQQKPDAPAPIAWIDMSKWDDEPVPEREWAIRERVPLRQAGLFSGEGGTGKSITELQKNVAHVLGRDWLGSMPEPGPAFYLGAEDDEKELHIRLAAIAQHYGTTFRELTERGLYIKSLLGQDATVCAANGKSGRVETTSLYRQLYEAAGDIKPKNISIDTLSRAFAGNEIDRVQVYAFANHMQALAMVAGGSVTVLSHPSLAGIASGSGISGSTAWHGAFRFRQYLSGIKPGDEQPDNDLRRLEFKKNQYGPLSEPIVLRYQHGLFLPEGGISNLDRLAREARVDEIFLSGLKEIIRQGRDAIYGKTSPDYAPTLIAELAAAKKEGVRKPDLVAAMSRLLAADKIHIGETAGQPAKRKKCVYPGAKP